MGRRPTATIDKVLRGNPGKRPINQREPVAQVGLPPAPDHLDPDARAHWAEFGAALVAEQRIGVVYGPIFATYCVAWSRWQHAERQVRERGAVTSSPSGYEVKSAWLTIADKAWAQVVKSLGEMGLTPTAQSRAVKVEPPADGDPFAAFDAPADHRVN